MKSENSTAKIKCTNDSHIDFSQSQCFHIANLELFGCGGNQVKRVEKFVIKDTKFEGRQNSGTAFELIETTAAQIVNSIFMSNRNGSYRKCAVSYPGIGCVEHGFVGGAIIATNSSIEISQSKFEDNRADFGRAIFAKQNSIISIRNDININNHATIYGGVLYSNSSSIIIEASEFHHNSAIDRGGALQLHNQNREKQIS